MSIQNIINRSQSIEIDRRKITAQTLSRSQRIKTIERDSSQPWRFKVTPPGQLDWATSRGFIEVIDMNDRFTEYEISLNDASGMTYITEYQGDLNATQLSSMVVSTTTTATLTLNTLPSIGATISTSTVNLSAKSFAIATNVTYNRAFSTSRNDFIIPTTTYDNLVNKPLAGDTLSAATYVISGQTISTITRNYIIIAGVSYTRIVMSAVPDASSPAALVDFDSDVSITASRIKSVSSSSVVLAQGDFIQPINSRYPYTVKETVLRGTDTTVVVELHRNIITSEVTTITNAGILVGNDVSWRVVVASLPTYQLIPGRRVQYTGDFELIERVI